MDVHLYQCLRWEIISKRTDDAGLGGSVSCEVDAGRLLEEYMQTQPVDEGMTG